VSPGTDRAGPRAARFHAGRSFERCFLPWLGEESGDELGCAGGGVSLPAASRPVSALAGKVSPGDGQLSGVFCLKNV